MSRTVIDRLRAMAIFASVVEAGSFRAAARDLGLAPSRVSETVSDLEKELGVTLLYRSTRRLSLTPEGQVLLGHARTMRTSAEDGLDAITSMMEQPVGSLRVALPAFVTATGLMDTLAKFAKAYPAIELTLHFSDRPSELIKDGYDLAIRVGFLDYSERSARNIGRSERMLVASPDYIANMQTPSRPEDLADCHWINFLMRPDAMEFVSTTGEKVSVTGTSSMQMDSVDALFAFAVRGLGVTVLPEHLATRGIARGELEHLLPNWSVAPLGFHAIWPDRSGHESLRNILVDFLEEAAAPPVPARN